MTLVLGIDPGSRHLGWGMISAEGSRLRHIAHGVIHPDPDGRLDDRLLEIDDELRAVVARHRPDQAAVESIFFAKDAQAAAKLGHARGVILLCLRRAAVPFGEYAPTFVKRTIVGRGLAEKRQVALVVTAILGLSATPPADAADALALAVTHARSSHLPALGLAPRSSQR